MLWKQRRPSLEVARDDGGTAMTAKSNPVLRQERPDRDRGLVDAPLIVPVEVDFESICARHPAHIAIAEVHPEQVTIGRTPTFG
jgi:hypothetical protein